MKTPKYKGLSFRERLPLTTTGTVDMGAQSVRIDGVVFTCHDQNGITIRSESGDGIKQAWVCDVGEQMKFDHHITATVRVLNPATNISTPMAIDLGYDTERPLSLAEWKTHQKYDESVIATAGLQQPFRIDTGTLSPAQWGRLCEHLHCPISTDKRQIGKVIAGLPEALNGELMTSYLNLEGSPLRKDLTEGMAAPGLEIASDRIRLDQYVSRHETLLKPLATYQEWQTQTDIEHAVRTLKHDITKPAAKVTPRSHLSPKESPVRSR